MPAAVETAGIENQIYEARRIAMNIAKLPELLENL